MTASEVLRRQNAVPFQPYGIMLVDGRELYIAHPDFVSVPRKDDLITIFDLSGGVEIVDLALVVSLRCGKRQAAPAA